MFRFKKDKAWDGLLKGLGGVAQKQLAINMRRASILNGMMMVRAIRKAIESGEYKDNAPLTVSLKGGNKPLVGYEAGAQLYQSITSQLIGPSSVFVGVLKTNEFHNIAERLHEGAIIDVTPTMRGMFRALWMASTGQLPASELSPDARALFERKSDGWKPLKESTQAIVIPPRPFIDEPLKDPGVYKLAQHNWQMAIAKTMAEIKRTAQ